MYSAIKYLFYRPVRRTEAQSTDQYQVGFPIRKFPDQRVLSPPRNLSQSATSFIASCRQGIHQTPFSRLIRSSRSAALAHFADRNVRIFPMDASAIPSGTTRTRPVSFLRLGKTAYSATPEGIANMRFYSLFTMSTVTLEASPCR